MRTTPKGTLQPPVTRQFEPSRHGNANLAAAFERAMPPVSRAVSNRRMRPPVVVERRDIGRAVS